MNPAAIFLTGLTAGGISCLAMQAGLLASALINHAGTKSGQNSFSLKQKLVPVMAFLLAKLLIHTLFGALLSSVGALISISLGIRLTFQVLIALFMLATAFNLLELHPIFRYVVFTPPRFLLRLIKKTSLSSDLFSPILLGLLTLFVPCGVTQAMELVAIGSGNFAQGAMIMFAFTLGTFPLFVLFGLGAKELTSRGKSMLNRLAAVVLILMSLYYLHGVAVVLDAPFTLNKLTGHFLPKTSQANTGEIEWARNGDVDPNLQPVTIKVNNSGYAPRLIKVKKDIPVELTLISQDTYSCALAFVFPEFGIDTMLGPNDRQVFNFTPTQKGQFTFTCSMGMYTGILQVE